MHKTKSIFSYLNWTTKYLPATFIALGLCACSGYKIPSESDIEKTITESFNQCKYIRISNVKKTDGMPGDKGGYLIKSSFEIQISPIDDNTRLWKEYADNLSKYNNIKQIKINETQQIEASLFSLNNEYEQKMKSASTNQEKDHLMTWHSDETRRLRNDMQQITQRFLSNLDAAALTTFDLTGASVLLSQGKIFDRECKIADGIGKTIAYQILTKLKANAVENSQLLGEGGKVTASLKAGMIKTEKGWQFSF